jgi:hypothetical protein
VRLEARGGLDDGHSNGPGRGRIPALDPRLAPLATGMTVDRVTFTSAFKGSLCVLQADARNRVADCP